MTTTTKSRKWLILAIAGLLIATYAGYRVMTPAFAPPVLPKQNGYVNLLRAAEMLAPRTGFYDEMEAEELAKVVQQNEPALELAREALAKDCVATLDWSDDAKWMDQAYLDQCSTMRSIARAFAAEGLKATQENNDDLAIRCALDNFRLGQATANGGLYVDWMVGQAIGGMGIQQLSERAKQLSHQQCQQVLASLEKLTPYLETPEAVFQREQAYYRHTNGLKGAYEQFFTRKLTQQAKKQAKKQAAETNKKYAFQRSLLRTKLAIRKFQLNEQRLPDKLEQLVPQYLQQVPLDQQGKHKLSYQLDGEDYVLFGFADEKETGKE